MWNTPRTCTESAPPSSHDPSWLNWHLFEHPSTAAAAVVSMWWTAVIVVVVVVVVLGCAVVASVVVVDVACSAPATVIDMTVAALNPASNILSDTRMSPAFLGSSTILYAGTWGLHNTQRGKTGVKRAG